MLKRIIMWRLKDIAQEKIKKDNASKLKEMLEQLPGKISDIEHFKIALNKADAPEAADVVLISFFADRQAYERFLTHPEHLKTLEFIKNIESDRWFIEYED